MTGYTKLFNSILTSTIWCQDSDTKVVWITMLAMANPEGIVDATIPGLARIAGVSEEKVTQVLAMLEDLDPVSRSLDNGGRRVKRVNGGYMLLNYRKYRQKRTADERKDYMRKYMRDYMRKKRSLQKLDPKLDGVKPDLANLANSRGIYNTIPPIIPPSKLDSVKNFVQEEQKKQEFKNQLFAKRGAVCMMPECGKPVDLRYKPFCSEACADYAKFLNSKHGPLA